MLKQNRTLLAQYPVRLYGGASGVNMRSMWGRHERYNRYTSWDAATPRGHTHPSAWILPKVAGEIASVNEAQVVFVATGNITVGRTSPATTAITFVGSGTGTAAGLLSASDAITFTTSGSLSGGIPVSGSASITFATNADLGGNIPLLGTASVIFSSNPFLTGTGSMIATPIDQTLTATLIAEEVWAALAADNNNIGSMGEKLNDAGSASNPWTEVIESGLTATEVMRILLAVAAGDATGLNDAAAVFKSQDGSKNRIEATQVDGNRTIDVIDVT